MPSTILMVVSCLTSALHDFLSHCAQIEAPVIDLEVRGVPALSYFGNIVWPQVFDELNAGECCV